MPKLCLIIPVLNEAEHINALFGRIASALEGQEYVLCFVDDGSTDATVAIVEKLCLSHPGEVRLHHRRKRHVGCQRGAALHYGLKKGLDDPNNAVFVEMDGDLSHRPEELPEGVRQLSLQNCDVLLVSKYMQGAGIVERSFLRNFVSGANSLAMRLALGGGISDYSNGYRFYNRRAAEILARHQPGYGSPIYLGEALAVWLSNGCSIGEMPGTYVGRGEGSSKVRLVDVLKGVAGTFHIGLKYRLGKYRQAAPKAQGLEAADKPPFKQKK